MKVVFFMDAVLKVDRDSVMAEIEENQKNVREMVMESYRDMQTYDVIILPLAECDIVRNTDYIFFEKKAPETTRNLLSEFQSTISRLEQFPESHELDEDEELAAM